MFPSNQHSHKSRHNLSVNGLLQAITALIHRASNFKIKISQFQPKTYSLIFPNKTQLSSAQLNPKLQTLTLTMEVGSLHDMYCIWSPIRSSSSPNCNRPLLVHSRVSISARKNNLNLVTSSSRSLRPRNLCAASNSDTLVAGSRKEEEGKYGGVASKKDEDGDFGDLKSWMHKNGLPPCKVVLKERPSHDQKHRPIHYVAASEDLQVKLQKKFFWLF